MRGREQPVKRSVMIVSRASKEQRCSKRKRHPALPVVSVIFVNHGVASRIAASSQSIARVDGTARFRRCNQPHRPSRSTLVLVKFQARDLAEVVPFGRATWFRCFTSSGTPERGSRSDRARCVERGLFDPEARLREPLRAAACTPAGTLGAHPLLELEATGDAAWRQLPQLLGLACEAAAQLVERVGQDLLGYAELARQLVQSLRRLAAQRLAQGLRQRQVRGAIDGHRGLSGCARATRGNAAAGPGCPLRRRRPLPARRTDAWPATSRAA